jgi:hypothetical protein
LFCEKRGARLSGGPLLCKRLQTPVVHVTTSNISSSALHRIASQG